MNLIELLHQRKHAMTAVELAQLLNVTPKTVRQAARGHKIPCYRVLGSVRFDPRAVANWLRERSA